MGLIRGLNTFGDRSKRSFVSRYEKPLTCLTYVEYRGNSSSCRLVEWKANGGMHDGMMA